MDVITEFLSGINVWLAVVLVDFAIFAIVYSAVCCFRLIADAIDPVDYSEGDGDYYDLMEDGDCELFDNEFEETADIQEDS